MKKISWIIIILCVFAVHLNAQVEIDGTDRNPLVPSSGTVFGMPETLDFIGGFDTGYEREVFYVGMDLAMYYRAGPFLLSGDITFINDKKYAPAHAMTSTGSLGDFYFYLNEGGLTFNNGILQLAAGRYRNYDEVNSPYSLFVNSMGIAANTLKFRWETNHIIYHTQWIELNWNSAVSSPAWNEYQRRKQGGGFNNPSGVDPWDIDGLSRYGFPDRGFVYKVFGLKIDDIRFGFLDATVFSQRPFDLDYFLIPLPMYFVQYFRTTDGRPWATQMNDNSMMGFFFDIRKDTWDAYAQIMIDDFGLGFMNVLGFNFSKNPWKAAWAFGGRIHTSIGRFGFHHGGALKYTFQPIGVDEEGRYAWDSANTAYGNTYYPETRFYYGDSVYYIGIQENMIGYKHGENNLAFQVDYQNIFNRFLVTAELEFVLAGNNSPANPWHDYDARRFMYADGKYGSQIFGDAFIEKRLEFRINVSRQFGPIVAYAAMAVGGRFNMLELVPPDPDVHNTSWTRTVDDEIWIWKASDKNQMIFRLSVGFRYFLPIL